MAEIEAKTNTGPGSKLTKARRAAGLSREEVAEKLHLSVTMIRQIENDQYDEQIPDAFARGYLRNYAKLLEIEPQEIIARYSQMIGSSMVKNYYEPSQNITSKSTQAPLSHWLLWFAIVVVIFLATVWFMSGDDDATQATPVEASESMNSIQRPSTTNENTLSNNRETTSDALTEEASQTVMNDGNQQSEAQLAEAVPTGFQETSEAQLEFYFIGDCWVQVTDANGEVLAVGLKTAGRRFEVSGIAPINIVLGKPRQVDISYNQQSVDLSCFPSATTARFELSNAQACGGM